MLTGVHNINIKY